MKAGGQSPMDAKFSFDVPVDSFQAVVGFWESINREKDKERGNVGGQKPPSPSEVPVGVPPFLRRPYRRHGLGGEHRIVLVTPGSQCPLPYLCILLCADPAERKGKIPKSPGRQKGTPFGKKGGSHAGHMGQAPLVRDVPERFSGSLVESPFPVAHHA